MVSIGKYMVNFGLNMYFSVTHRPDASSSSNRLLRYSTTLFISMPYRHHVEVLENARHENPRDRNRDEHLPAEPHDLVVAVTRESRAQPDQRGGEHEELQDQPPPAGLGEPAEMPALERAEPAAHEQDRHQERHQDHVRVFGEEEQRERRTRILDVETRDDFRFAFGDVERQAIGLGDA